MDREKLDGWCEKGILGLVLAILVTGPLAIGGAGVWQFLVLQGLTIAVMLLWVARFWVSPRLQFIWPPICWAVLAFVAYAVVRYLQADLEYVARQELIKIIVYAFLFFIILNNLHRQESKRIITLVLVFLGMAISFYAFYQFSTKSTKVWNLTGAYQGRGTGTFYNPDHLAGFLEMLVPLGLCTMLIGRLSHVTKVFLGYAVVVMLAGIGVTLSRGGWLVTGAMLLTLCGVLLTQRNYRIQALVLLVLLLGAGFIVATKVEAAHERLQKTFSSGKADDLRFYIWQPAVQMWEDNLWLGVGPGHFDYRFRAYKPNNVQRRPDRAHNDYLNTLADYGLIGALLVVAAWALLYLGVAKAWKFVRGAQDDFSRKKSNKFAFLIGASLGLLAILLHSFFDFNMHVPANAILAIALMAFLSSQLRFATERYWFTAGPTAKWVGTAVVLAGVAWLGGTGWRGAEECVWLRRAARTPIYSHARIAALKEAFAVEPKNFATTYAIAECYRVKSWVGSAEYVDFAKQAMEWYQRGMKLNPYDGYNSLRYGMCLDWIGPQEGVPQEDSTPYFDRANALDPNGYFTTANTGWHFVQTGDYAAARTWLDRSLKLEWTGNNIADRYLPVVDQRLKETAETLSGNKPLKGGDSLPPIDVEEIQHN